MSGGTVVPGWDVTGFKSASGQAGVMEAFIVLGIVYMIAMTIGALSYRVPPEAWAPEGWISPAKTSKFISSGDVHLNDAHKTLSFWMIWGVLFLNVTAGIAVLSIASPMLQTIFGGTLIDLPGGCHARCQAGRRHRSGRCRLCRPALAVQHRRPLLLGLAVGQDRPQDDLLHLLRAWHDPLRH